VTDFDTLERRVLESARRAFSPTEVEASRHRVRTLGAIAVGAAVPSDPGSLLPRATRRLGDHIDAVRDGASGARVLVAAVAMSGMGAAGYGVGFEAGRRATAAPAPAMHVEAPPPMASHPEKASPEPAGAAMKPLVSSSEASPARSRSSARVPASPTPPDPGLELRTLRRVERALRDGNARFALSLLDDLEVASAGGGLLEERRAARAVAECAMGGSASAGAFAARHPESVYLPRIRQACAGSSSEGDPASERIEPGAETQSKNGRQHP